MPLPRPETPSPARTWTIPANVDELNAAFATLDDDEELAAFARGLHRGVNLGKLKDGAPDAMVTGFDLGAAWRMRAEEFRSKQQKGGETSAAIRAAKFGTSQPPHRHPEDTSKIPRSDFEPDPEGRSNLSSIQYPLSFNPETSNQLKAPCQEESSSCSGTRTLPKPPAALKKKKPAPWEQLIHADVVQLTNDIFDHWPNSDRKQPNGQDYVPASSRPKLAARLMALRGQGVDLDVCLTIAKKFTREFGEGGMWAKAAENFFGKVDDAPWVAYYNAHMTNRKIDREQAEDDRLKAEQEQRDSQESPFEEVS